MYTLRIIEEKRASKDEPFESVIKNFEIGNSYSILKNGSTREFDELLASKYPDSNEDSNKSKIRAIICCQNGLKFFIFADSENEAFHYFVMTESGKTFEKL